MKSRRILAIAAAVLIVLSVGACKKYRYCHCITTEGIPDTMIINIDRSMRCDHILEIDRTMFASDSSSTKAVSCIELDEDTVAVIVPRPAEEE